MTPVLDFLSKVAPWVWTAAAISGALVSGRVWWLARHFQNHRKGPGLLTRFEMRIATLRALRCLGYVIVGTASIATSFAFPSGPRPELPTLVEISSLFTLIILLAVPITDAIAGYWTLRFLLDEG